MKEPLAATASEPKLHIVLIQRLADATVFGPYKTDALRLRAAKRRWAKSDSAYDAMFRLNITNGVPSMSAFGNFELE